MQKITLDQIHAKKAEIDAQRALYAAMPILESIKPENEAIAKKLNRLIAEYRKLKGSYFAGNN